MSIRNVWMAQARANDAQKAYYAAVADHFKVGVVVSWMHGLNFQHGVVQCEPVLDRVKVRNANTDRIVWVFADRFIP